MYMREISKCKKEIKSLNYKIQTQANFDKTSVLENELTDMNRENA